VAALFELEVLELGGTVDDTRDDYMTGRICIVCT
jgi:hypothetical protein